MKIQMVVLEGTRKGMIFDYDTHDSLLVGRGEGCGLQLVSDPAISRHHLIMEFKPPRCFVKNLGRNGTKVNDAAINEGWMQNGDTIELGRTRMKVEMVGLEPEPEEAEQVLTCGRCNKEVRLKGGAMSVNPLTGYLCEDCKSVTRVGALMFDRYRMGRLLGRGGNARVYLALDRKNNDRRVVIKVLAPQFHHGMLSQEQVVARFKREGAIGLSLKHPNIVETLDVGADGPSLVMVMEHMGGGDMQQKVRTLGKALPIPDACRWIIQAMRGLAFAHAQKVIHRDVKPGNILLTEEGPNAIAKIADLGLAKNLDSIGVGELTLPGLPLGSAAFMPPEQIQSMAGVESAGDVYSSAATLYWLLANDIIYTPETRRLGPIPMVLDGEIRPIREVNPNVPEKVWAVLEKALSRTVGDRYPDAGAFADALEKVAPR